MKLEDICPDFAQWPEGWMATDPDLPYGRELLDLMRAFVDRLIASDLPVETIETHMHNLRIIGREIILDVGKQGDHEILFPEDELRQFVGPNRAAHCRCVKSDSEPESLQETCRELYHFLETKPTNVSLAFLFDIESEAETFARSLVTDDGTTLWERLVARSQESHGATPGGPLMHEVADFIRRLLSQVSDRSLYSVWQETENGAMSPERTFEQAHRCEMLDDTERDAIDNVLGRVCEEAKRNTNPKTKRRRKKKRKT